MASTPNAQAELYADHIDPVTRSTSHEVFFLSIEAYPEPGSDEFGNVGGAYVHCYLDVEDLRAAESGAIALMQEHGWRPHRLEGWEVTSLDTADGTIRDDNGFCQRDLVRTALDDGLAIVFYSWEIDAPGAMP